MVVQWHKAIVRTTSVDKYMTPLIFFENFDNLSYFNIYLKYKILS
jgi:hypothetical protein